MKTISVLIIIFFLFSCSKADPQEPETFNPVGTWSLFKLKLKQNSLGPLVQDTFVAPCLKGSKFIIENNGSWTDKYVSDTSCRIYFAPTSLILWKPDHPVSTGTWTINDNTITVETPVVPGKSWSYPMSRINGRIVFSFIDTASFVQEMWYVKD